MPKQRTVTSGTKRWILGTLAVTAVLTSTAAAVLATQDGNRWRDVVSAADSLGSPASSGQYSETRAISPDGGLVLVRTWDDIGSEDPTKDMRADLNAREGWTLSSTGGNVEKGACVEVPTDFCSWYDPSSGTSVRIETVDQPPSSVDLVVSRRGEELT